MKSHKLMRRNDLFIVLAACAIALSGCSSSAPSGIADPPPVVGVASVARKNLSRKLVLAAEFRPYQEVDIHAKVAGYLKSIRVDIGDRVKQGQQLAKIEVPELADQLKQADAAIRQSEAEVERAKDELQRSKSGHEAAHLAYARLAAVVKSRPNLVAQQEVDDALGRDRIAEAQVSAAQAAVVAAQDHLEVSQADRNRLQTLYSYTSITAPFTGVITRRYADPGAMIQAGTASQTQSMPVVRLSQNDRLRLIIPVPESAVPKIKLGSLVQVQVPALKRTIAGKVARFADRLDLDTRTMETEIDVGNPNLELVPGMYAEAAITLEERDNVLTVPVEAIERHEGKPEVYLVNAKHQIQIEPVETGLENPNDVEVVSGLSDREQVVVSGRAQLRPNETIQPKPIELSSAKGPA
ncbi:MAG TPA: efflux RND transporter periplasmic adaptor subunit [Terriglobales bacterium]|nr:efflux RND transporter periplasmic adaptor subunit [Terriglobales bacterium]